MTPISSVWLKRAWRWLRSAAGDDAYDQYCQHQRQCHPHEPLLDRRTHYLQSQEQKWGGINRCC
ncbi:MAG: hypothetical protein RL701_4450 [Pseudomonadota bacterium]|jgi:uncharacterized short protein YbdD (DUF466 family)